MLHIEHYSSLDAMEQVVAKEALIDFLYTNLGAYRDDKTSIDKCLTYAFSQDAGKGGFVLLAFDEDKLAGALIMNYTGMEEFIPEYILVYLAVDSQMRGKGIGRALVEQSLSFSKGQVALHVEYDNPAKRLYERMGFTSKYAEMRWKRS